MAVKTITIDLEAYKRLRAHKREDESFSQTIKRLMKMPVDPGTWFKEIDALGPFGSDFVEAVEKQVKGRRSRSRKR